MSHIKKFSEHLTEKGGSDESPQGTPSYLQNMKVVVKGDKDIAERAKKQVGDGKEPNLFYVTINNDYMYYNESGDVTWYSDNSKEAPVIVEDHIEVEVFEFENFKDAMKKVDETDINEEVGPRYVCLEDRKTGQIYEKFLKAEKKVIWGDETNDDTKRYGYSK